MINFRDWPEEKAKTYPGPYAQVLREVKPERERQRDKGAKELWWRYLRPRPELLNAIAGLDRVIVITRHTKTVMPLIVPTGQVMSDATVARPAFLPVLAGFAHRSPGRRHSSQSRGGPARAFRCASRLSVIGQKSVASSLCRDACCLPRPACSPAAASAAYRC